MGGPMGRDRDGPAAGTGAKGGRGGRQARLAEALRRNLQRRKAQQRGRAGGEGAAGEEPGRADAGSETVEDDGAPPRMRK